MPNYLITEVDFVPGIRSIIVFHGLYSGEISVVCGLQKVKFISVGPYRL